MTGGRQDPGALCRVQGLGDPAEGGTPRCGLGTGEGARTDFVGAVDRFNPVGIANGVPKPEQAIGGRNS